MKFNPVLAVCIVLLSAVTAWLFYMGSESWVYAVGEGVLALAFLSVGLGGVSLKEYPRSSVFCVILSWLALVLGVVWGCASALVGLSCQWYVAVSIILLIVWILCLYSIVKSKQ